MPCLIAMPATPETVGRHGRADAAMYAKTSEPRAWYWDGDSRNVSVKVKLKDCCQMKPSRPKPRSDPRGLTARSSFPYCSSRRGSRAAPRSLQRDRRLAPVARDRRRRQRTAPELAPRSGDHFGSIAVFKTVSAGERTKNDPAHRVSVAAFDGWCHPSTFELSCSWQDRWRPSAHVDDLCAVSPISDSARDHIVGALVGRSPKMPSQHRPTHLHRHQLDVEGERQRFPMLSFVIWPMVPSSAAVPVEVERFGRVPDEIVGVTNRPG